MPVRKLVNDQAIEHRLALVGHLSSLSTDFILLFHPVHVRQTNMYAARTRKNILPRSTIFSHLVSQIDYNLLATLVSPCLSGLQLQLDTKCINIVRRLCFLRHHSNTEETKTHKNAIVQSRRSEAHFPEWSRGGVLQLIRTCREQYLVRGSQRLSGQGFQQCLQQ